MKQGELKGLLIPLKRAQKGFESGRSMVEMLGVLAIVGVLSVTGISGFSTAMSKHKANEAAQQVGMARMELESASALGGQENASLSLSGSYVSLVSGGGYTNAGIEIDFADDVKACKQFVQMYENSSDYYVKNACEE